MIGVTKHEFRHLLESFKSDLLENINLQLDTLQFKKKAKIGNSSTFYILS